MSNAEFKAELIATMTENITAIEAQQDRLKNALVGHNTVIKTSEGLYLTRQDGKFYPACITHAVRYTPEDGKALAASVTNGAGDVAQAVGLHSALATELQAARDMLAMIQSK